MNFGKYMTVTSIDMPLVSNATIAAYHLYGIEAGIVLPQKAKDWAFSIIESLDNPPADIIDVAMSGGLPELNESLQAVIGERDRQLAGRWLLCKLNRNLQSGLSDFRSILLQAKQVAQSTDLGDDENGLYDEIEYSICLVEDGICGSMESCRADLVNALAKYKEGVEIGW